MNLYFFDKIKIIMNDLTDFITIIIYNIFILLKLNYILLFFIIGDFSIIINSRQSRLGRLFIVCYNNSNYSYSHSHSEVEDSK